VAALSGQLLKVVTPDISLYLEHPVLAMIIIGAWKHHRSIYGRFYDHRSEFLSFIAGGQDAGPGMK